MPERTDIDARGVGWGALAILGGIVFAIVASWLLLRALGEASNTSGRTIDSPRGPAQPKLQSAPQPDRAAYTAEKEKLLSSYGWVDREAGVARIPLDEAMRLIAARGSGKRAAHGSAPADEASKDTERAALRHAAQPDATTTTKREEAR